MFDAAHARLDTLITRTLAELHTHRQAGGDDESYQAGMVEQFVRAAADREPTAGHTHMALALYRLAIQRELIAHLRAEVARYASTLADLDALEGLA